MNLSEMLLPELDQESKTTRTLLERIPAERCAWRPHAKSWTLGDLSVHLANLPSWVSLTLGTSEFDVNPPGGARKNEAFESPAETLRRFDANVFKARASLAAATDAELAKPWSLKNGGAALFTMPKSACLRFFVLNHLVHHRGQLTVYLRLCDVPLPKVYGPTADIGF